MTLPSVRAIAPVHASFEQRWRWLEQAKRMGQKFVDEVCEEQNRMRYARIAEALQKEAVIQ